MKKMISILLLITSISSQANDAIKLNKGDKAPFTGALVKEERLNKLVKAEKKVLILNDISATKDDLIELYKKDANNQRLKLSAAKFDSNLKSIGMFVLGVVITGYTMRAIENNR